MKQFILVLVLIPVISAGAPAIAQVKKAATIETLRYEGFGAVRIYRQVPHPGNVVLFVSGRPGWTGQVIEMATELSTLDSLVAGIDANQFLGEMSAGGEKCSYYSYSFEDLSHYIQQKLGFPRYISPILIGFGEGAAVAYSALVQSHTGVFRGAISPAFCPNLSLPAAPCSGNGLQWNKTSPGRRTGWTEYLFSPAQNLATPWIVLEDLEAPACSPTVISDFVRRTSGARLVNVPAQSGRGTPRQTDWLPRLKQEYASLVRTLEERSSAPDAPEVKDLPLEEVRGATGQSDELAIIVSGDGGWAGIDRDLAQMLAGAGVSVVGINSLQYFWTRRTPESAAADLSRILRHYLAAWNKRKAILAGYSMGADVLSFMAARLPEDLQAKVALIVLIGPSVTVDFEFHFTEWFGGISRKTDLPVVPEIEKLKGKRIICVYGLEEGDNICTALKAGIVQPVALKGGHHFGGEYKPIADLILKESR